METGPFTRFIAAGKQGHLGVELWIEELGKLFHTDFNGTKDACVWHQNSRMLIPVARCNFGSIAMDIAVLYAPPRGRGHEELQQWWNEPEHVLQQRDRNILRNIPFFCLGDFNCKVGNTPSQTIGDHASDVEDEGGARFRQLCEKHDLLVPATFSQRHQGPTGTYTGPKGARSRIDYIAVSQSCQEGIERSYVDQEIDILNGERDHRPLLTEIGIKRSQSRVGRMVRQDIYSRRCARSAKMCEPHNFISNLPLQDSAFVKLLLLAGSIQRIDFLQGPLGQPFPKPASLLAGRLPDLPHQFFALNQLHWRAAKRLGG